MDENEIVKAGMEVALRPITAVAEDAIGVLGGDWLSEKRKRNRAKLHAETEKVLNDRGIVPDDDPSPSVINPLLTQAQDESRDDLVAIWARLLATAIDPARSASYRRQYVDIAKALEPLDAQILPLLNDRELRQPTRKTYVSERLQVNIDQVELAIGNLTSLGLVNTRGGDTAASPNLTPLGREFCSAVGA